MANNGTLGIKHKVKKVIHDELKRKQNRLNIIIIL